MSLYQSNNIQVQKDLSNYRTKKEFADALYLLRSTVNLKTPRNVKELLKWVANMAGKSKASYGVGAFFHELETIAAEMGCSTKTVQRALAWLRKHGLIFTYNSFNYNASKTGSDYKVFASYAEIKAKVKALVAKEKQHLEQVRIDRKLSGAMSGAMSSASEPEKPVIPSDEGPKNGEHIRPLCKTYIKKDIKNRLSADKQASVSNPFKFIKPEIVEIVKSFPWHGDEQPKIARKVQKALTDTKTEMSKEMKFAIIGALKNAVRYIEKDQVLKNPAKKYNYIYQCVKTAINGHLTKHEKVTDESGKLLGVVKHEHYYKTEEKLTLNKYLRERDAKPERKEVNPDAKWVKSDAGYLPDWFDENIHEVEQADSRTIEEKRQEVADQLKMIDEPITPNSITAKLNAFHEMQPRKVNNLWG